MASLWDELARIASKDARVVEAEAAAAWVLRELGEIDRDLGAYTQRYATSSPEGLEALIRSGMLEAHPAWEDRLAWANLIGYRNRLLGAMPDVPFPTDDGAS